MSMRLPDALRPSIALLAVLVTLAGPARAERPVKDVKAIHDVLTDRCLSCHDARSKKGGLNLEPFVGGKLPGEPLDAATVATWVRIHDRVRDGEMPPRKKLADTERSEFLGTLRDALVAAETKARQTKGRSALRRLNRTEYENTLRDLLGVPGLEVRDLLPEDGRVQGYDKSGPALEFSTVQVAKYLEAAGKALPWAIAPYPERDTVVKTRMYPGDDGAIMDGIINGCGACLKDFKFDDKLFPLSVPSGNVPGGSGYGYFDQLKKAGKIPYRGSVGFLRNGDDYQPDFSLASPVVPGYYRVRISLWGFRWDKGQVKPTTPQIGRLLINTQFSKSRGGLIGHFDAPSLKPTVSEAVVWLNPGDSLKFQPASVLHDWQGIPYGKLGTYVGDGVAVDWVEVEGPLVDSWPGVGHRRLFGDLPMVRFEEKGGAKRPARHPIGQYRGGTQAYVVTAKHQQAWTVASADPAKDARKLLADFLPLAFRRPVEKDEVRDYVAIVLGRVRTKATFEEGMLTAYKAALCSPDFL
ncbi:MAG: DUF1587 domain-containing protein, partial [Gemmataceae bacterium]